MSDVLNAICEAKLTHIARRKALLPLAEVKALAALQPAPRGFIKRLQTVAQNGIALITEVKKASPSKGVIRADFDPVKIAKTYEQSGAACLSVLTDEPYFQGADEYLTAIKSTCPLPALRKDFMLDPYQIFESRALGADCVLLIMAALGDEVAHQLHDFATSLGMDVLVEVHNAEELERAIKLRPAMIGVNNRNLKTLEVSVQTSFDLAPHIPPHVLKVAESGLSNHATIVDLQKAGYSAFLVGESLMRQDDIGRAVTHLLGA